MSFEITEEYYNMVPEEFSEVHIDFYKLFAYIKIKYIRNSYRWRSTFKNQRIIMTKFDYSYANENDCFDNFAAMQHFVRKFQKIHKSKVWNIRIESEYVDFIKKSMREIITNLIVPVSDLRSDIYYILKKYRDCESSL
jgi:hypothetical protein